MRNEKILQSFLIGFISGFTSLLAALMAIMGVRKMINKRIMRDFDDFDDDMEFCDVDDMYEDDDPETLYISSCERQKINDNAVNDFLSSLEVCIREEMKKHENDPVALENDNLRLAATIIMMNPNATPDELHEKLADIANSSSKPYEQFLEEANKTVLKIKEYALTNHKINLFTT